MIFFNLDKEKLRKGILSKRRYASYFNWDLNKDEAERGAVRELEAALKATQNAFFKELCLRGRGHDPPDLEAITFDGLRLAIEVTELVDGNAIEIEKSRHIGIANKKKLTPIVWDRDLTLLKLQTLISDKDNKFLSLKDGPYPGGYCLVIHTDEPQLTQEALISLLEGSAFHAQNINRCFLLLGYSPPQEYLTYFELRLQ